MVSISTILFFYRKALLQIVTRHCDKRLSFSIIPTCIFSFNINFYNVYHFPSIRFISIPFTHFTSLQFISYLFFLHISLPLNPFHIYSFYAFHFPSINFISIPFTDFTSLQSVSYLFLYTFHFPSIPLQISLPFNPSHLYFSLLFYSIYISLPLNPFHIYSFYRYISSV